MASDPATSASSATSRLSTPRPRTSASTRTSCATRSRTARRLAQVAKDEGKSVDGLVKRAGRRCREADRRSGRRRHGSRKAQADELKQSLDGAHRRDLVNGELGRARGLRAGSGRAPARPGAPPAFGGPRAWQPEFQRPGRVGLRAGLYPSPPNGGLSLDRDGVPRSRDCIPRTRDYKERRGEGKGPRARSGRARGTSRSPPVEASRPSPPDRRAAAVYGSHALSAACPSRSGRVAR